MNSKVYLKKCETYDEEQLNNALNEITLDFDKTKIKDKRILLFFDEPAPDERILKAIIKLLRENGCAEVIAGTSIFVNSTPEKLKTILKETGVDFIDFRESQYERLDVPFRKEKSAEHSLGFAVLSPIQYATDKATANIAPARIRILKNALLPVAFTDSDYIVPVLKMKDSPTFKIGGFVNSMLYLVPTITRGEIFMNLHRHKGVESILDIFNTVREKVLFGILDGIEASISNDSQINKMNVILSSQDVLSLDAMLAVLIGFKSSEIPTNELGNAFDFGNGILKRVDIYGDDFEKLRKEATKNLRFPNVPDRKRNFPQIIQQNLAELRRVQNFCPTGAIIEDNGSFHIDRNKCIKCNFCTQIADKLIKMG
ncbi:MAG: DUF362 domain-containing protein [Caldisericaceae bacterium]